MKANTLIHNCTAKLIASHSIAFIIIIIKKHASNVIPLPYSIAVRIVQVLYKYQERVTCFFLSFQRQDGKPVALPTTNNSTTFSTVGLFNRLG
jgi:hypothetical protein